MTKAVSRIAGVLALAFVLLAPARARAQAQPQGQAQRPPAAQSEYVPADQLPAAQQERMPAAPLVIIAYAIVWLALLLYLWSIWRRLQKVDRELADVKTRIAGSGGASALHRHADAPPDPGR